MFLISLFVTDFGVHSCPDEMHIFDEPASVGMINFPAGINPALKASFLTFYPQYRHLHQNQLITLIDFGLPSSIKRLWTFEPRNGELLFHSLVAHGKQSGDEIARNFSNRPESHQSSLEFYLTQEPYIGSHGLSMRLVGLESGINDKAFERAIVVHGADYVSDCFIQQYGRLGRSHGCPALPHEVTKEFITLASGGSILFIWHPLYSQLTQTSQQSLVSVF